MQGNPLLPATHYVCQSKGNESYPGMFFNLALFKWYAPTVFLRFAHFATRRVNHTAVDDGRWAVGGNVFIVHPMLVDPRSVFQFLMAHSSLLSSNMVEDCIKDECLILVVNSMDSGKNDKSKCRRRLSLSSTQYRVGESLASFPAGPVHTNSDKISHRYSEDVDVGERMPC